LNVAITDDFFAFWLASFEFDFRYIVILVILLAVYGIVVVDYSPQFYRDTGQTTGQNADVLLNTRGV